MFDFQCRACDVVFEDLVQSEIRQLDCPKCGATACRIISPVHIDQLGMAMQEGFPGAVAKFEQVHRERKAIEEKSMDSHGDYGPAAGSSSGKPVTREDSAGMG